MPPMPPRPSPRGCQVRPRPVGSGSSPPPICAAHRARLVVETIFADEWEKTFCVVPASGGQLQVEVGVV